MYCTYKVTNIPTSLPTEYAGGQFDATCDTVVGCAAHFIPHRSVHRSARFLWSTGGAGCRHGKGVAERQGRQRHVQRLHPLGLIVLTARIDTFVSAFSSNRRQRPNASISEPASSTLQEDLGFFICFARCSMLCDSPPSCTLVEASRLLTAS